ncbi:transcription elongation factor Elf1 like-domain-containing protein [Xylaria telfairii]|nr:transcription elongation factor Elf1 like-domain-containing protein [Xylaria telfairii]
MLYSVYQEATIDGAEDSDAYFLPDENDDLFDVNEAESGSDTNATGVDEIDDSDNIFEHQRTTQVDAFTMGKRKKSSRKPQGPKKREGLAKEFTCLFCNHEKSVHVKLDKKAGVGQLSCAVCGQQFQCSINTLMEAIDVYSEWVDAADAVAKEAANDRAHGSASFTRPGARAHAVDREVEDEEDEHRYEGDGIVGDDDDY